MANAARRRRSRSTLPALASLLEPPETRLRNRTAARAEWRDPDDASPSAARTAREISGFRAFCPLRWCIRRHGERSAFTELHVVAADRLRLAFDGARLGFSALRDWRPIQATFYRPAMGPTHTALRQLRARKQFDAAWAMFLPEDRAVMTLAILQNVPIGRAAELLGKGKPQTTQALVAALDRLVALYDLREAASRAA